MEEHVYTDEEFDQGLRAVLGSHYKDLTRTGLRRKTDSPRQGIWEWICWGILYGCLGALALWWR